MLTFSVAIRTLGKSPETLRAELESLHAQTVKPEKIIIYLAKGYERPSFTVGYEEYVLVNKGMVTQRALPYDEIDSECVLLLDDDVAFDQDSVEQVIKLMEQHNADCIAYDTFENHKMSLKSKIRSALVGFVFPRFNKRWAFKIHWNGSFSYINNPGRGCYPSMSAAGPASLWKKTALKAIHFEHELWLDKLEFAYGEDAIAFYKLHLNGGRLMVAFDYGVSNLDAKTASSQYHRSVNRFKTMAKANTIRWHRSQYLPTKSRMKAALKTMSFGFKMCWQLGILSVLSVSTKYRSSPKLFVEGIKDGMKFVKSAEYRSIPPYLMK